MRAGDAHAESGKPQVSGTDPDAGDVHPPGALSGGDDPHYPGAQGQPLRPWLASYPFGFPDDSVRDGSRLSPVLSITPITPRIYPMCLNVISSGSRATVCDTVRIHTLPSDPVRLSLRPPYPLSLEPSNQV